jgi:hypothetical protein
VRPAAAAPDDATRNGGAVAVSPASADPTDSPPPCGGATQASWLPPGCEVDAEGHLRTAGCDAVELARLYGTPLYVFNEDVLRANCRAYRAAFAGYEGGAVVAC